MRWLFYYVDSPTTQMTGGGRSVRNLVLGLRDRGIRPVFVSQCYGGVARELETEGVPVRILSLPECLDVYDKKALDYSIREKVRAAFALLQYNRRVSTIAQKYGAEGIWARGTRGILQSGGSTIWNRLPLVWDITVEQPSHGLVRGLHVLSLLISDKIVTEAKVQPGIVLGHFLSSLYSLKLETIHPGIAPSRIAQLRKHARPNGSGKHLISVASIHPRKNQMMALRAFEKAHSAHPTAQLDLVGAVKDEQYARTLHHFVDQSGLDNSVRFLGWRDDVPALLGRSNGLILSSHREGVPHVVREAMFAEVPVIATAVGGVPDAVVNAETGFLVPPGDVDELGKRIDYLLSHPEDQKRMGTQGLERARQQFSREEWLTEYAEILRDLSYSPS